MSRIDATILKEMILSGANHLIKEKALVDKLNVFPVPDGDTGTNMSLTLESAIAELGKVQEGTVTEIGKAITKGSLMGARGNSGVILSQLLRGFGKSVEGKEELSCMDFAEALDMAAKVAYKAVIKPVEGTILTVARETAEYAVKIGKSQNDMKRFLEDLVGHANDSLNRTPELLKALKDAGVVDSGGKGFVIFLEGMYKAYIGEFIDLDRGKMPQESLFAEEDIHIFEGELEYGYCTEFMVRTDKISPEAFKAEIESYGDSLIVVGDDELIKIHIHTNNPGEVMEKGIAYGLLDRIKIENMRLQHEQRLSENQAGKKEDHPSPVQKKIEKPFGVISVAMGGGIREIMEDFGVDHVIEGGQTMNPSTQDFLSAIEELGSEPIFILPNNSNIIMAANQAKEISEKQVVVIPSKSIPQAFAALMHMDIHASAEENEEAMNQALSSVKTGQITYAVRDTNADGLNIKKDDIIGIGDKQILAAGGSVAEVAKTLIDRMVTEDSEIISLFYGEDVKPDFAALLKEEIEEKYPDCDVEMYAGGQPLYYYIISVE